MTTTPIAFPDRTADYRVREDRGDYDPAPESETFYEAQRQVGDALNLAGLLLKSLEDEGDARAMQICAAVSAIEEKLTSAYRCLDEFEMARSASFLASRERNRD